MRRAVWIVPLGLLLALLGIHAGLVLSASPMRPLRAETLLPDASSARVDDHFADALLYAPWIFHETDNASGRADIPTAFDFDGDMEARDNWEEMPRYELLPTVYYTFAETETHAFITYHLYHPRDWARVPLGIQDTHEGDGENIQVVVEKANFTIVVLVTQAHYRAFGYASLVSPVQNGDETLRADFEISTGHPIVYVESGGHGIYGSHDPRAANRLAHIGRPIVTYTPGDSGATLREPGAPWNESAPYRLLSLPATLANATEHPTLFAGYEIVEGRATPRYHLGDRYSGPLGASRGISPFALGFGGSDDEFASLFWDPAARYPEAYAIEGAWARAYVAHPFR